MNDIFMQEGSYLDIVNYLDASRHFDNLTKSLMIKFLTKTYTQYEDRLMVDNNDGTLLMCAQKLQMMSEPSETKMGLAMSHAQDLLIQLIDEKIKGKVQM